MRVTFRPSVRHIPHDGWGLEPEPSEPKPDVGKHPIQCQEHGGFFIHFTRGITDAGSYRLEEFAATAIAFQTAADGRGPITPPP
jgi:hypothetical protein